MRATMARTHALPAAANGASTLATTLYDQLRADVLAGLHEPGGRLAIEALCERYATSQTPLREALNRLVADGLVQRREQRGFAVSEVSAADLVEITSLPGRARSAPMKNTRLRVASRQETS